jgi:hypothetical protein
VLSSNFKSKLIDDIIPTEKLIPQLTTEIIFCGRNSCVETEKILSRMSIPRNRYINEAIEYYNKVQKRQILEKKLKAESNLVKNDSMTILKDFEKIDYAV